MPTRAARRRQGPTSPRLRCSACRDCAPCDRVTRRRRAVSWSRRQQRRRPGSSSRWGRTAPSTSGGRSRMAWSTSAGRSGLDRGAPPRRRARRPRTCLVSERTHLDGGTDQRPPGRQRRRSVDLQSQGRATACLPRRRARGPRAAPVSSCRPTASRPVGRAWPRLTGPGRSVPGTSVRSASGAGVRRITSPRNPRRAPGADEQAGARSNPLTFFTVGPPPLTTSPAADT